MFLVGANEQAHADLRDRLIKPRQHAANTKPGIIAAYAALVALVLIAGWMSFKVGTTHVRVETKTRVEAPKGAAALEQALGAASQTVPGEQINAQLKGATCSLYQPSDGLIIVCR